MGTEHRLKARKKWWLLAFAVLAVGLVACVGLLSRDPFTFIGKHKGRLVHELESPSSNAVEKVCFAFTDEPSKVEASIRRFAKEHGLTESEPGSNYYGDWPQFDALETQIRFVSDRELVAALQSGSFPVITGSFLDGLVLPKGTTCFVMVQRENSWLELRWAAVRRWFGG